MKKRLVGLIGRFQPWHNGHKYLLDKALSEGSHVIVFCGSSNVFSNKNPWSFAERKEMILATLLPEVRKRVVIVPLIDLEFNHKIWLENINKLVEQVKVKLKLPSNYPCAWIGHHKDSSSDYLNDLSGDYLEIENYKGINASDVRNIIAAGDLSILPSLVPKSVYKYINGKKISQSNSSRAFVILVFIFDGSRVMFRKDSGYYFLPMCELRNNQDLLKTKNALCSSWYNSEDIIDVKQYELNNRYVFVSNVKDECDDINTYWLDKYRIKSGVYFENHASIAFRELL